MLVKKILILTGKEANNLTSFIVSSFFEDYAPTVYKNYQEVLKKEGTIIDDDHNGFRSIIILKADNDLSKIPTKILRRSLKINVTK